jgi:penicillin-binding protein 2
MLLAALAGVVTLGLAGRLFSLSVVNGAEHRAAAEARLRQREFLPTYRGSILDRRGRVLAVDRPSYNVAVHYHVISGAWARKRAEEQAKAAHREAWGTMTPPQREAAAVPFRESNEKEIEALWAAVRRLGGLDQVELDRRLDAIRQRVQSLRAHVWRQHPDWIEPRPIGEERQAHVILADVENEVAFELQRVRWRLPGVVEVRSTRSRDYPWSVVEVVLDRSSLPWPLRSTVPLAVRVEGVADHVLGSVRDQVWAEDTERRPFKDRETGRIDPKGYLPGDVVGSRGLERAFEDQLRGWRGEVVRRDGSGQEQRVGSVPGEDLVSSLDIALQARIAAVLSPEFGLKQVQSWHRNEKLPPGWPLNAAAVVLEIETGEILAAVSVPTLAMGRKLPQARREQATPWVNRPLEGIYPPGSIIKPLVLAAAVSEGEVRLSESIECRGHYFPNVQNAARCWLYREQWGFQSHGPLQAEEGLARSCNVYYYTLADRLGMGRLVAWFARFGLGRPIDVGLGMPVEPKNLSAWRGSLPVVEAGHVVGRDFGSLRFATISMGIGQGPVTWTPLHAAAAYATLARSGADRTPTLVSHYSSQAAPSMSDDLLLDEALVTAVLEGLRQAVSEEHGSAHHIRYADGTIEPIINATGVTVWAKTGTAEAPPLAIDSNGDGETDENDQPITGLDHAWFVGLVGPAQDERPHYALAVVVEHGGSGSRVAGPVANQIIRAMQVEGYLPADAAPQPPREGGAGQ